MTNSARAAVPQSSEKGKNDGQSDQISPPSKFWFPVYEGLFAHAPTIRDAVWLFAWLIARTTQEKDGKGLVLGGVPIHDERIAEELGFPRKTIRRWRLMLVAGGYISTVRTPYGFRYTLLKSKKWQKQTITEVPKLPISAEEKSQNGHRDVPQREQRSPAAGISKKTIQRQHREEAEEATAAAPSPKGETKSKPHPCWEDAGLTRCGTPKFCRGWESAYDAAPVGEDLVDLMESFIQYCQAQKIPVPPPFYQAKHAIEAEDAAAKQEPPEIACIETWPPQWIKDLNL